MAEDHPPLDKLLENLPLNLVGPLVDSLPLGEAGESLALQITQDDTFISCNQTFKDLFPGAADENGIASLWLRACDVPSPPMYAERSDWVFIRFKGDEAGQQTAAFEPEYAIPLERVDQMLKRTRSQNGDVPPGECFYFGEVEPTKGIRLTWFFKATNDLRIKRDRYRNEIAALSILDAIFDWPALNKMPSLKQHARPRDGNIGGDFLFVQHYPDDEKPNLICYMIGDCTGHGVEGALLSVLVAAILRGYFERETVRQGQNHATSVMEHLQVELTKSLRNGENRYTSLAQKAAYGGVDGCVIVFEPNRGILHYCVGNTPLWLCEGSGTFRKLSTFNPNQAGKTIGYYGNEKSENITSDTPWDMGKLSVKVGKTVKLVALTDGYYNQTNANDERIGEDAVTDLLQSNLGTLEQIVNQLVLTWETHLGTEEQDDDLLIAGLEMSR